MYIPPSCPHPGIRSTSESDDGDDDDDDDGGGDDDDDDDDWPREAPCSPSRFALA